MRPAREAAEVFAALALRERVFCGEQGVSPASERDGRDAEALHLVAVAEGGVIGTCRIVFDGPVARLGRMAVAAEARGRGIGAALLEEADRRARAGGAVRIALHAQQRARRVYERAGYEPRGAPFLEEGIEHMAMEKQLV